jgi:hypothetical protein
VDKYVVANIRAERIEKVSKPHKTVIFGAGEITKEALSKIDPSVKNNIVGLVDNDINKVGLRIHGIRVYSIDSMKSLEATHIIINVEKVEHSDEIYQSIEHLDNQYKIINLGIPILNDSSEITDIIKFIKYTGEFPVAVFQMGKVGSRTVVDSLGKYKILGWHIHLLSQKFNEWKEQNHYDKTFVDLLKDEFGNTNFKIKIITFVRDPIARNMASFFQNIERFIPNLIPDFRNGKVDLEYIIDIFLNHHRKLDHDLPLTWWDQELKNMFGIDILDKPFHKERGYEIYKSKNVEVLVIKLEKLNLYFKEAFKEFLGIQDFELVQRNIGLKKSYGDVYKLFKESIVFPKQYIDRFYNAKAVTHFYTDEEIETFKSRIKFEE